MDLNTITLRTLPPILKALARWALIVMAVGYAHGLLYVLHTTGVTPHGVEEQYRGNQQAQQSPAAESAQTEMKFQKSYPEMVNIIHTHIIGMGSMFCVTSIVFAFCSIVSGWWKKFLLIEPFIAILTSFGSMWLMWEVHPLFSWLLMLSSGSMAVVFYITIYYSLRELMMKPEQKA